MALNSSGPISLGGATTGQSINLELGQAATATASINAANFRALAGVASGQISLSNFYGKSSASYFLLYSTGGSFTSSAYDSSGNIFISGGDNQNNSYFLKINSAGTVLYQKVYSVNNNGGPIQFVGYVNGGSSSLVLGANVGNGNVLNASDLTVSSNWNMDNAGGQTYLVGNGTYGFVAAPNGSYYSASQLAYYNGCFCYSFERPGYRVQNSSFGVTRARFSDTIGNGGTPDGVQTDSSSSLYLFIQTLYSGNYYASVYKYNSSFAYVGGYMKTVGSGSRIRDIAVDASSNYYLGMVYNSSTGNVIKLNSSFAEQWYIAINGAGSSDFTIDLKNVVIDSSSNVYVMGNTVWNGSSTSSIALLKFNSSGTLQWKRRLRVIPGPTQLNVAYPLVRGKNLQLLPNGTLFLTWYFTSTSSGYGGAAALPTDGSKTGSYAVTGGGTWVYEDYTSMVVTTVTGVPYTGLSDVFTASWSGNINARSRTSSNLAGNNVVVAI